MSQGCEADDLIMESTKTAARHYYIPKKKNSTLVGGVTNRKQFYRDDDDEKIWCTEEMFALKGVSPTLPAMQEIKLPSVSN